MDMAKGKKAMFPTWLSPTQVRLIPVGESHKDFTKGLVEQFSTHDLRVDFDDRDEPLGKKIRDAQKEWIPYIAVIGDKELESKKLSVTIREDGSKKDMSVDELAGIIVKANEGKPFERLSLPQELSKRPVI
jgi:threonyl-tRNA synthetase